MEMVKCMLNYEKLNGAFCAKVVKTTIYLLNRTPTKDLEDQIPQSQNNTIYIYFLGL